MKVKKLSRKKFSETKSIHSNCGVFGIFNNSDASVLTYYGLHALQHRGQEAAGIVTSDYDIKTGKGRFNIHKDLGLVLSVFSDDKILTDVLKGNSNLNIYSLQKENYRFKTDA